MNVRVQILINLPGPTKNVNVRSDVKKTKDGKETHVNKNSNDVLATLKEFKSFGNKGLELMKNSSNIIGIPGRIYAKLRYCEHYTHTHTSGALSSWEFRGNSVYDPDYTYTGHQPSGFDEYSAFYMYYRVKASSIKVTCTNLTADIPVVVVVLPRREIPANSSWIPHAENSRSKMTVLSSSGTPAKTITNSASTGALYDGQFARDQDFGAVVTANPAKTWYWTIVSQSANGSSTSSCSLTVDIEYEVEFSQKQFLGTS